MSRFDSLWVEKYRPKTLNDIVLSNECRNDILNILSKKDIPHLLFTGKPGIGKTSLAKIITYNVLDRQCLYLNMSDKGIDAVRDDIVNFAETKSLDGEIKIIICDEFDGCSNQAQKALRNIMEEYANFVRFIITANNKNNIITAIQSRCINIDITFSKQDVLLRCVNILKQENISLNKEDLTNLAYIIKGNFPDIRKIINILQKICNCGKFKFDNNLLNNNLLCDQILDIINNKDILSLRKFIIEQESNFNSDYNQLLYDFLNYIYDNKSIENTKKIDIIITIRDFIYQSSMITDLEINTFSCFLAIYKIIKN